MRSLFLGLSLASLVACSAEASSSALDTSELNATEVSVDPGADCSQTCSTEGSGIRRLSIRAFSGGRSGDVAVTQFGDCSSDHDRDSETFHKTLAGQPCVMGSSDPDQPVASFQCEEHVCGETGQFFVSACIGLAWQPGDNPFGNPLHCATKEEACPLAYEVNAGGDKHLCK